MHDESVCDVYRMYIVLIVKLVPAGVLICHDITANLNHTASSSFLNLKIAV